MYGRTALWRCFVLCNCGVLLSAVITYCGYTRVTARNCHISYVKVPYTNSFFLKRTPSESKHIDHMVILHFLFAKITSPLVAMVFESIHVQVGL